MELNTTLTPVAIIQMMMEFLKEFRKFIVLKAVS